MVMMKTDVRNRWTAEFIQNATTEELCQILAELEIAGLADDHHIRCSCGYLAIGNDSYEIIIDLGEHTIANHADTLKN